MEKSVNQNRHLTFKENAYAGRHRWLRLTPSYSFRLVSDALNGLDPGMVVLDPFCGTGTTGVVTAMLGGKAHLLDINPFLVWLSHVKTRNYDQDILLDAYSFLDGMNSDFHIPRHRLWEPSIFQIEKWWPRAELQQLKAIRFFLDHATIHPAAKDLMDIAFCRTVIQVSNAAFNHQSMSFRNMSQMIFEENARSLKVFFDEANMVLSDANAEFPQNVSARLGDARQVDGIAEESIDILLTSPPYANRMSYIRELRPYMYWLRFLSQSSDAGELDWDAIGGTWGIATSRVGKWSPAESIPLGNNFTDRINEIRFSNHRNSGILARYVEKYFHDMYHHFLSVFPLLRTGGRAIYIVGNSTFYGHEIPTHTWYRNLMEISGFSNVSISRIRKRNSNKALFEYLVEGRRC